MTRPEELEDKTGSVAPADPRMRGRPRLLAIWDGGYASAFLPEAGALVLGRGLNAGLRISSNSVSREHAEVTSGSPPMIRDLGSSNGTRVDGQLLEQGRGVELLPGRVVELGSALVVMQEGDSRTELASSPHTQITPLPSPAGKMDRLYRLIDLVAAGTLSVILQGETGVGKEVMAKRIHQRSARADQPFLKINCAAFAESMVESELFGHERGAFTGAATSKAGLLEAASGGTVLLDEVAELSLPMQAKLLRAVGNAEVLRIGSLKPRTIDVRFIAATNGDFNQLIARGAFRSDLYFRLNGISLTIPPLRQRTNEIGELCREFITDASERLGLSPPRLSERASAWLLEYEWPGNIRELKSVIERAVLLAGGRTIDVEQLQVDAEFSGGALRLTHPPSAANAAHAPAIAAPEDVLGVPASKAPSNAGPRPSEPEKLRDEVERLERERIVEAIGRCGGNQTKAAELLGISRRALLHRLDAYGLPRPRKGNG